MVRNDVLSRSRPAGYKRALSTGKVVLREGRFLGRSALGSDAIHSCEWSRGFTAIIPCLNAHELKKYVSCGRVQRVAR